MADTGKIYLPLNTYVNVYGFTNAAFEQRITITEENGTIHTMTGQGEYNAPMQGGNFAIQTPGSSSDPSLGYQLSIQIESLQGGNWIPSKLISGMTSLMYFNMILVTSEDYSDQDWNDAVAQFCWWTPPNQR